MCVLECIAQHLPCNPISFVADERNEIARRALHIHTKFGTIPVALTGSEFFSQHAERPGKLIGNNRGGAQSLHRIPALRDRLPSLLDDVFQRLIGITIVRLRVSGFRVIHSCRRI